jgi:YidC/Oxa1 family membrane protein insertase
MEIFRSLVGGLGHILAFFYDLIPSYGVAIILLTAAVRLAMVPLTVKQMRSMQQMQKLQPEIKRIQAKHKGDRQKLGEEMSKLYREQQVNPLGGCLPLLLQFPIFIALYQVFIACGRVLEKGGCAPGYVGVRYLPEGSALRRALINHQAGFLGMDLGDSPTFALREDGLLMALPYIALIVLMAATTWYQQKQVAATQSGPQAAQMQMIGKIMPLMLAAFSVSLPAGVSVYWVASNLWTIGQQHLLLGRRAQKEAAAGDLKRPSAAARGGPSGVARGPANDGDAKSASAGQRGVPSKAKPRPASPNGGVRDAKGTAGKSGAPSRPRRSGERTGPPARPKSGGARKKRNRR